MGIYIYIYIYVCVCVCVCMFVYHVYMHHKLNLWYVYTYDTSLMIHLWYTSLAQSCLTLCDPMNCSTPGLPVQHQLKHISIVSVSHPAITSSFVPFSSYPQFLPASDTFTMSQLLAWGEESIGVSALASVLPMNTQYWYSLDG